MDNRQWKRIKQLFNQAVALPPTEREPFVLENTRDEEDIAEQVLQMLKTDSAQPASITQAVSSGLQTLISE